MDLAVERLLILLKLQIEWNLTNDEIIDDHSEFQIERRILMTWNEIGGFNQKCETEWVSGKIDDIQNEIDDLKVFAIYQVSN